MKHLTVAPFSLVALATIVCGNGWCNQPAFQKYSISSPPLFSCDDSDLKSEINSLQQKVQQSCSAQSNIEQLQSVIRQLSQACNISALVAEISQLREEIRMLKDNDSAALPGSVEPLGSPSNPAANCNEIFLRNSSATTGPYWLNAEDGAINVTCDFDIQLPPPSPARGWQEIVNIDLSNPTNSCPSPLREVILHSRRCEKSFSTAGCDSAFFPTNGMPFSKLCGRAVGYARGTVDGIKTGSPDCAEAVCYTYKYQ